MRNPRPVPARQAGQGAVELLALVPALLLVGFVAWQMIAAAHVWVAAAGAARAGARAEEVGAPLVPAVRAALPGERARVVRVRHDPAGGSVTVRLPVPGVIPLTVTATSPPDGAPVR